MFQHLNHVFGSLKMLAGLSPEYLSLVEKKVNRLKLKLPKTSRRKKTLFLDLDETLIHSTLNNNGDFTEHFDYKDVSVSLKFI
jgi:TFIIF-interacting CTD phosphatase-like protein